MLRPFDQGLTGHILIFYLTGSWYFLSTYRLNFRHSLRSGFPPQEEMSAGSFPEKQLVIEPIVHSTQRKQDTLAGALKTLQPALLTFELGLTQFSLRQETGIQMPFYLNFSVILILICMSTDKFKFL